MEFLLNDFLGTPTWMWAVFISLVLGLLALDLGVLHKNSKEIGIRESLLMSGFYIAIGLAFGGWIWYQSGQQSAMEYVTGFVVEKSLAMDNIFIIAMIFSYFAIPRQYQHRVLLWGILGVIVLRGIMIAGGAAIVENFHWVLYLFAAFLVFTGLKMLFSSDHDESHIGNNRILKFLRSHLPVTNALHGEKFFVKETDAATGKLKTFVTPLFLALIMVEIADLIFAVDFDPGDLRDHHRSVYRLHLEHLRDPRPARPLFCACRPDPPLRLSEIRAGCGSGLRRFEDFRGRHARHRQDPAGSLARRHRRHPRNRHHRLADRDTQGSQGHRIRICNEEAETPPQRNFRRQMRVVSEHHTHAVTPDPIRGPA